MNNQHPASAFSGAGVGNQIASRSSIYGEFKKQHPFEKRIDESKRIMEKYPTRIPVIVEMEQSSDLFLDKRKYLIPKEMNISQFLVVIRKRIKTSGELKPSESIYLISKKTMLTGTMTLEEIYNKYHDSDNFLYILLARQNVFG